MEQIQLKWPEIIQKISYIYSSQNVLEFYVLLEVFLSKKCSFGRFFNKKERAPLLFGGVFVYSSWLGAYILPGK
jgi:hypothetical protein